jgi:hypothetical protein
MTGLLRQGALCVLLLGLLGGCASTPERWYLNGRSHGQFQADDAECAQIAQAKVDSVGHAVMTTPPQMNPYGQMGAGLAGLGGMLWAAGSAQSDYVACLKQRGYTPAR